MNSSAERSDRSGAVSLVLIGFLTLFLELSFIRWLPANVLSLAYFSNIVLISCFAGLGLGCLVPARRDLFVWFPPLLAAVVALVAAFRWFEVVVPADQSHWIWSSYGGALHFPGLKLGILPALVVVFTLNLALFVPIGRKTASLMGLFLPIRSYSLNIAGSLLGIAAFSLLSFAGAPPAVWLGVVALSALWFFRSSRAGLAAAAACGLLTCAVVVAASRGETWSPYYNIQVKHAPDGSFRLYVNKFFHQRAVDLDAEPEVDRKYGLAYLLKKPQRLLILGAGTGNDVAVALRRGVPAIDAVEIDPVIARLGRERHPARPYQDPRVRLYVDDARSFLQRGTQTYDMVLMGTLDSHALLSGMSTVRLDNFVYTVQALEAIKRRLSPDGVAVLMFSVPSDWLGRKLLQLCLTVFLDPAPWVYQGDSSLFNLMVVAGPGMSDVARRHPKGLAPFGRLAGTPDPDVLPTDDWPYLYLSERSIPALYVKAVALLALFPALGVLLLSGRSSGREGVVFFCLGAAFLLLETKSVTTLSLLFGSTWIVNAFVFSGILVMILLANLLIERWKPARIEPVYACLGLALLAAYLVPPGALLGLGFWSRSLLASALATLPLFFAALIFGFHFAATRAGGVVYGLNLLGAVLGGFVEYSSMVFGLNTLYLLAGVLYLAALLAHAGRGKASIAKISGRNPIPI